jgi:hypothetical protein
MCQVTNPPGYSLINVCGGFLCFALTAWDREEPAIVCNPVTGEKVKLPNPKIPMSGWTDFVALGFSPSTHELKLFRYTQTMTMGKKYLDVCTLGDSSTGGWRRRPYLAQHCPMYGGHLPMLVGGKLCVVIGRKDGYDRKTDGVLVIDVASETHCTYRLPRASSDY